MEPNSSSLCSSSFSIAPFSEGCYFLWIKKAWLHWWGACYRVRSPFDLLFSWFQHREINPTLSIREPSPPHYHFLQNRIFILLIYVSFTNWLNLIFSSFCCSIMDGFKYTPWKSVGIFNPRNLYLCHSFKCMARSFGKRLIVKSQENGRSWASRNKKHLQSPW